MSKPITFGELEFNLVADMKNTAAAPDTETPFRILIMGDFSGRTNRGSTQGGTALTHQRPIRVDRDNLDVVMEKLNVILTLPVLGKTSPPVEIRFSEIEDFHPDRLYERLEVFQSLKDTRRHLENPATFAAVARNLKGAKSQNEQTDATLKAENRVPQKTGSDTDSLLDQIIAQTPGEPSKSDTPPAPSEWDSFLQEIVKPHLVSDTHPRQAEMLDAVDAVASELMRMVLHHPVFLSMEAAWKGLHFLVSGLETDALLKLYLLDISKEELSADLNSTENLRSTALYRLIVTETVETPGSEPWAVLIGNYHFEKSDEDIATLGRIAKIAKAAGAPFIAAASDKMVCRDSLARTPDPDDWEETAIPEVAQAWEALRKLPDVAYIGLALPRFILRLPYGVDTEPVEVFDFEEIPSPFDHDACLWGNPGFACALLLGQAFSHNGWRFRPGDLLDVRNLPLYVYKDNGESKLLPCAETVLTQRAAEIMIDNGLMPLLSFLNQDTIRLARFQAIAAPLSRLAGRWEK